MERGAPVAEGKGDGTQALVDGLLREPVGWAPALLVRDDGCGHSLASVGPCLAVVGSAGDAHHVALPLVIKSVRFLMASEGRWPSVRSWIG